MDILYAFFVVVVLTEKAFLKKKIIKEKSNLGINAVLVIKLNKIHSLPRNLAININN